MSRQYAEKNAKKKKRENGTTASTTQKLAQKVVNNTVKTAQQTAKAVNKAASNQGQPSSSYQRRQQAAQRRREINEEKRTAIRNASQVRANEKSFIGDAVKTAKSTLKQTAAEEGKFLNRSMKGITQKDAYLYTTQDKIDAANKKADQRDEEFRKRIKKESEEMEKLKQGHSYIGQQALSAVSSTVGMATDMAWGPASLAHMFMRTTAGAQGNVKDKVEPLKQKMAASGNYSQQEIDEMFKDVDKWDAVNAVAEGGIEVLSEKMFEGIGIARKVGGGGILDKGLARLTAKMGSKASTGMLGNVLKGTAEEIAEEEIGNPLQALASNLIYGNRLQSINEDAHRRELQAQSDAIRSRIQSPEDAQAIAAQLSSKSFLDESKASFLEVTDSEEEAEELAELSRDYLTAAVTGDTAQMQSLQEQMVKKLAGGDNSYKERWTLQDAIDAAVSTSIMTSVTGGPAALSTERVGSSYRDTNGMDAVKNLAQITKNLDADKSIQAQAIIDRIDAGESVSGTQVYELMQWSSRAATETYKRQDVKERTAEAAMKREGLFIAPSVRNSEDGSVTLGEETERRYDSQLEDILKSAKEKYKDVDAEDIEVGADVAASYLMGTITANQINELTIDNPAARSIFHDAAGIDLNQFNEYDRKGDLDVVKSNIAMQEALFAKAADNYVESARIEQENWNDGARGEVAESVTAGLGSNGDEAVHDALNAVDPRDRSTFMLMGRAAQNVYDYARYSDDTWDSVSGRFSRMFPSLPQDALRAVYESGKKDKIVAETPYYNAIVSANKSTKEIDTSEAERTEYGKFTNEAQRQLKDPEQVVFQSLAKTFNVNIRLLPSKSFKRESVDAEGKKRTSYDNGFYDTKTGTIYLNGGSDMERNILAVALHELTHHIAIYAPDEYLALSRTVMDKWYKGDAQAFRDAVSRKQESYKKTVNQNLSEEQALEEVIADAVGEMSADEQFVNQICREEPSLAERIITAIKDVLRKLRSLLSEGRVAEEYEDAFFAQLNMWDDAQRLWLNAAKAARKARSEQMVEAWDESARTDSTRHSITEGLTIQDGNARWTDERVDDLIQNYGASNPDYSQAYAVLMDPRDFLKLTLPDERLEQWNAGVYDDAHPEVYPLDESQLRGNSQAPFLTIFSNDGGEVFGHEGRHRMRALMEAGVTSVPVVIRDTDTKYTKQNMDSFTLTAQDFGYDPVNNNASVTVTDLVPIKESNRDELIRKFGGEAQVRFSIGEDITEQEAAAEARSARYSVSDSAYLDAVNRGDMDEAQRMVDEAARAAGYDSPLLYHGTTDFGFTQLDATAGDDGISFFATDSLDTANTYAYDYGTRQVKDRLPFNEDDLKTAEGFTRRDRGLLKYLDELGIEYTTSESHAGSIKVRVPEWDSSFQSGGQTYSTRFNGDLLNVADKLYNRYLKKNQMNEAFGVSPQINTTGVYQLYANTDGLLKLDAYGKNWNDIRLGKITEDFNRWWKEDLGKHVPDEGWPTANTRAIAQYAKQAGYQGVLIENVADNGGKGSTSRIAPASVYIFFDPASQAKSADPVTYDDNGDVIPLSERFNEESPDVRFSIDEAEERLEENFDEYKEDKENLRIAAEALTDLQDVRYSVEGNTSDISGRWRRGEQVRTIGKGITADLVNEGYVEFRGRKVKGPEDLAKLCQVLRDPRFETFRVVLTKGDKIVSLRSISSRLPGLAQAFESENISDGVDIVRDRMKRTGADGYYLIHNHPSGNVTASFADLSVTRAYLALLGQDTYKGHIILDHDKYGFIDADVPQVIRGENFPTAKEESITGQQTFDLIHEPEIDHPLLGEEIHGHADIAKCGQFVNASDDVSVLLYTNSPGEVTGIQEISNKTLKNNKEITGFIRNQGVEFGAASAFLYTTDIETYQASKDLVKSGHLVDSVVAYGNNRQWSESAREVVSPRADVEVLGQVHDDVMRRTHVFESATGATEYRYSLPETDNEGKALTQDQREFFRDVAPELLDDNGNIKRYFHGTARADRVGYYFNPERATSGPMAYFTDNRDIATNYSRDKADTSLAYEDEDVNDYHNQFVVDVDGEEVRLEDYWYQLPASKKLEYREKAGHITYDYDGEDDTALIIDENVSNGNGGYGADPYLVRQSRGNVFRMLIDAWLDSGDFFNEEERFLEVMDLLGMEGVRYKDPNYRDEKVYEVYLNVTNPLVTTDLDEEFAADVEDWLDATDLDYYPRGSASADMWDKNDRDPYDWLDALRDDIENGTTHVWTSIPDVITDFLKEQGYDGIVDQGGKYHEAGHQVVIPFEPNQIKLTTNEHPTDDVDIRYSIDDDSRVMYTPYGVEVVQNPTDSEYRDMRNAFFDKYPWLRGTGEPPLRRTFDEEGNVYYWESNTMHSGVEPFINMRYNTRTAQQDGWWKGSDKDDWPRDYSSVMARFSIEEDLDEPYMSAVNSGDMETAQRLVNEAAKSAGWTVEAYHGTGTNFTVFDAERSGQNYEGYSKYGKGLYFTDSKEKADSWGKHRKVMPVYLNTGKMFEAGELTSNEVLIREYNRLRRENDPALVELFKKQGKEFDRTEESTAFVFQMLNTLSGNSGYSTELLRGQGYDGVIAEHGAAADAPAWAEYVVFDPEQIKLSDPVTYAEDGSAIPLSQRFDPNNNDIRYSLPTQDSDGNILSDGQMEYFKNSQARDEQGRLVRLYHGTMRGPRITVFDGGNDGYWFTSDLDIAMDYSMGYDVGIPGALVGEERNPYDSDEEYFEKQGIRLKEDANGVWQAVRTNGGRDLYWGSAESKEELIEELYSAAESEETVDSPFSLRDYYPVYLNLENPMVVECNGSMHDDINGEGMTTREYAAEAMAEGYDGIIFRNVVDPFEEIDVYVAFRSNQIKDVRNEDPTENPDIRYSVQDDDESMDRMAYEYAQDDSFEALEQYESMIAADPDINVEQYFSRHFDEEAVSRFFDSLKDENGIRYDDKHLEEDRVRMAKSKEDFFQHVNARWNDRWTSDGEVLDIKSVKKDIRNLVIGVMNNSDTTKKYKSEIVSKTLIDARTAFQLMKQGRTDVASYLLYHSALRMIENVDFIYDETFQDYKDLRDYLRQTRIVLGEEYWSDVDFGAFRKANFGRMKLVRGDTNVDSIYGEMAERWPEWFNEEEQTDVPEMLMRIDYVLDRIQPYKEAYTSEAAADLAFDIADELYDIIAGGKEVRSLADTYKARYDKQTKAMKARHEEAMQRLRQQRGEGIQREKAKFREYKETQKEKKYHSKYFDSISKSHKALAERLLTNTKDKHIPEMYKKDLAQLLAAFDLQTVGSKKVEARRGVQGQKTIRMEALKMALRNIENSAQLFHVNDAITDIIDELLGKGNGVSIEGKTIDELSASELKQIDKLLKSLIHEFNVYESVRIGTKRQQAADIGSAQIDSALTHAERFGDGRDYQTTLLRGFDNILNMGEVTPAYLFRQVDPDGTGIGLMFKELRRSFDKYVRNQDKLNGWIEEIVGEYHNKGIAWNKYGSGKLSQWRSTNYARTFDLTNGSVTLTPAQMMSIYCLAKRAQAYDHMVGDGIVVRPVSFQAKMMSDVKQKANYALPVKLTADDITTIITALDKDQIKVADKLQDLMSTKMAEWGNEASMAVLGIRLFEDPDYFPIKSDRAALEKDFSAEQFEQAIRNFGFAKAVAPGARNAIMVDDIFDVVAEHCNNMNLYNSYSEAMNDFMKVYNYKQYREDDSAYTVEQAIAKAYSQKASQFITTFVRDLNGNVSRERSTGINELMNDALGKAKKASVFANGRVALQQPTAIVRAFAVIDPKYLKGVNLGDVAKGVIPTASTKAMDEMFEHCPIALWKSWGYYDINMGKSVEDLMMNNGSWIEDKMTDIYGQLDNVTWTAIWQMVKAETKDIHPELKEGSEEFWEHCNERMTEVVDLTQVVDSPFHRSHAMRSKSFLDKMFTAFMAEPTLTFNMLRDGLLRATEAHKSGDNALAGKIIGRTATVFLLQAATVAAAAAIWDAVRGKDPDGDDEDDDFFGRWYGNFIENFKDNANPVNNIYYLKDIASIFQGWDQKNLGLQGFKHLADAKNQLFGTKRVTSKLSWYENALSGIGYLTGIPFKTLIQDGNAMLDLIGWKPGILTDIDDRLMSLQDMLGGDSSASGVTKTKTSTQAKGSSDKSGKGDKLPAGVNLWTYDNAPFHVEDGSLADQFLNHFGVNLTAAEITSIEAERARKEREEKIADIQEKVEALTGEDKDKKVWSYVTTFEKTQHDGKPLNEYIKEGDYSTVNEVREMYLEAGGRADYFDSRIYATSKKALKLSIVNDPTDKQIEAQGQIKDYLLSHGMTEAEMSEIAYKSNTAKDLKAAFRLNDEDAMVEELIPLIRAGLTYDDFEKLYKYRNSGRDSYSGKYKDRFKSTGTYNWPITGQITSNFGHRSSPGGIGSTNHQGLDIAGSMGDPVGAADGGTVIYAGWYGGAGKTVMIEHDDGTITQYSHLSWWDAKVGDVVGQGQVIGNVGSTGNSTGPHLHFGVKVNGEYVDPLTYLSKR